MIEEVTSFNEMTDGRIVVPKVYGMVEEAVGDRGATVWANISVLVRSHR